MPYNSLRPIREKKGLTIAQLAGKTSISIRTLQSYEAGERAISPDDLRKLSRVLYASPAEILQPSPPPPPPPARPTEPAAERLVPPAPAPTDGNPRPPAATTTAGETLSETEPPSASYGRHGPPRAATPRPPRPPRAPAAPRPPGPSTPGQIEQIRNLARRLGLDDAAVADRIGATLDSLDHATARAAIATLRKELEESGTWQPRITEGPDQEAEYLGKLRALRVPIVVQLINGERFEGTIEDTTPYVIRLRDAQTDRDVSVRKLAIAYYRTQGPVNDAQ